MDKVFFFKNITDLAPKPLMTGGYAVNIPSKEQIQSLENEIMSELERFHLYLLEKNDKDRNVILEWLTNDLLTEYYLVRLYMKGKGKDEHRRILPLLNILNRTLTAVIYVTVNRLKLEYQDTFIDNWKNKVSYFPYKDLMKLADRAINKTLPTELQTDTAKQLFQKAIQAGMIAQENNLYKWNFEQYTGQLLAYFCQRASHYLDLSKRTDRDGNKTINWKVFEKAFGVKNIISYKNDFMKIYTKFTPNRYENIDKLFDL